MDSEGVTSPRSFDVTEAKKQLSNFVRVDHDRNGILEVSSPGTPNRGRRMLQPVFLNSVYLC
jgi:hypothetical protein